ncbi:MAG: toll/interleukin-1 receptor domain-containing protein [Candidatus Bipolaricaulia bacterium]
MSRHALAYVNWDILRRGPGGHPAFRANFYRSKSKVIYKLASGGTLWIVTSVVNSNGQRIYTLAYKLAGCMAVPKEQMDQIPYKNYGKYAVIATNAEGTYHFSFKSTTVRDFTSELLKLRFTNKKPIQSASKIGWWLRGFPEPDARSVEQLIWMERKLRYGCRVLISYAREDEVLAAKVQKALEERGLTVWRDLTALRAGENWRIAVQDNLRIADAFVVLLSDASLNSEAVIQEVHWALGSYAQLDGPRGIFPLLLPGLLADVVPWEVLDPGIGSVPLRDLNARTILAQPESAFFDRLALDIATLTEQRSN